MALVQNSDGVYDLIEPGPAGLCGDCGGSGTQWKIHPGGEADLRWVHPLSPCPKCSGRGGWVWKP